MAEGITRDVQELFGGSAADNPLAERFGSKKAGRPKSEHKKSKSGQPKIKKPKGLHREVWNLRNPDDSNELPPLMPTDTYHGYTQMRMKAGLAKVTPWLWAAFSNTARKDGALFYHWVKSTDKEAEYPFAKLNRQMPLPSVTDKDYQMYLIDLPTTGPGPSWTYAETQHLLDLCNRFDCRFPVIQDRWNKELFPHRSVEDLKERYYNICNAMTVSSTPAGQTPKLVVYDADHERRRKEQLKKLLAKTVAEVEEEEHLLYELKKIEQRKKDRERKAQDLQRFISGDSQPGLQKRGRKRTDLLKASLVGAVAGAQPGAEDSLEMELQASMIKFPELKSAGTYLRSAKLKMPNTVAQRKIVALERILEQYGIDFKVPIATDQLVNEYNNLRRDLLLVYELRESLLACDAEIRALVQQYHVDYPDVVGY